MNVLVLDTSTLRATIGLRLRSGTVFRKSTDGMQKHGRDLIPSVAEVLASGGVDAGEIEAIGVALGPGSYTGLRVGVMAAKTLAYLTGAPLIGIDSLEAIAWNAPGSVRRVCVLADAQRGEVYSAEFVRKVPDEPLVCARASGIEPLSSWARRLEPGTLVLGPGLESNSISLQVPSDLLANDPALNYPDGIKLLEILDREWAAGRRDDVWLVEPRYLRRSAAEEKWESRKRNDLDSKDT